MPAETTRDVGHDLEALAVDAEKKAATENTFFHWYSRIRDILWTLTAALAGLAGVLAIVAVPKGFTAAAAFLSAFSTGADARFNPAERRLTHKERKADYTSIAWQARHPKAREAAGLRDELQELHSEMHRLDREDARTPIASARRSQT